MIEQRFRFTLTKRQVEDLEDNLMLDDDIVTSGIEQPDGTYQFDLGYEDLVILIERLAAACTHDLPPSAIPVFKLGIPPRIDQPCAAAEA